MISGLASIPVLAARGARSTATWEICSSIMSTGTGTYRDTPSVFWAVMAVIALVPWHPSAANVFRSAWIPAPPPESDPAIVSATGSLIGVPSARRGSTPPRRRR
jgi:hypothetical protein